ncbi:alanine racemase [Pseudacidobacterium ailaaui]|uniref:alanine racemase n=1 Tax=Pseudacidobacterium ailaaui TaxID=1382359 RepID=UPI0005D29AE5|nr:alanine racemase [Pseudacidobacterium ailaaui]
MNQMRPVWAEISRLRLLANWKLLCAAAPAGSELVAVLKANAYGHGALLCGPVLAAAGVRWFGVTCVEEGIALRRECPDARILVMSGFWEGEAEALIEHRLTPQVWEGFHFELLQKAAQGHAVAVHLEIDTGMSRQGVRSTENLKKLLARYGGGSPVKIEGVMTHFSAPEVLEPETVREQVDRLDAALEVLRRQGIRPDYIHGGNSATVLAAQHREALAALAGRYGARLMLRPGIALYGYPPRFVPVTTHPPFTPVLAWKTRIVSLREIEAGAPVGYNMTFRAERPLRLALIPVGYADGLNRLLSNRGQALVRGKKVRIAGRVSMDQTILDVTDVPGVTIGDEVALIGEQSSERITAFDLADATGTIPYEVTCAISARVPRLLVD